MSYDPVIRIHVSPMRNEVTVTGYLVTKHTMLGDNSVKTINAGDTSADEIIREIKDSFDGTHRVVRSQVLTDTQRFIKLCNENARAKELVFPYDSSTERRSS